MVDIDPSRGVSVDAKLSPIVVGTKNLFSLTAAQGDAQGDSQQDDGPHLSVSTFQNSALPQELQAPLALINGSLTLLGVTVSVYAKLTSAGFAFDLSGDLLHAVNFDLQGSFGGGSLAVSGSLDVSIGSLDLGPLGTVNIDAGMEVKQVECKSHPVVENKQGDGRVTVALKNQETIPNKDFVLRYRTATDKIADALLTHKDGRGSFFTIFSKICSSWAAALMSASVRFSKPG
jgi:hypothetical protein